MELVLPAAKYKDSFIEAVKEYQADTNATTRRYRELSIPELEADFGAFVEQELSHTRGENLPDDFVPQSEFWLVDGGEYIGHAVIRHRLTEHLSRIGGQIGYNIRPSKRHKGYGTAILPMALPKAKALGIKRALLTCDATNTTSRRIIERTGGVLENEVPNESGGPNKLRFWIDIP